MSNKNANVCTIKVPNQFNCPLFNGWISIRSTHSCSSEASKIAKYDCNVDKWKQLHGDNRNCAFVIPSKNYPYASRMRRTFVLLLEKCQQVAFASAVNAVTQIVDRNKLNYSIDATSLLLYKIYASKLGRHHFICHNSQVALKCLFRSISHYLNGN